MSLIHFAEPLNSITTLLIISMSFLGKIKDWFGSSSKDLDTIEKFGAILYSDSAEDFQNCVKTFSNDKEKFEEEYAELIDDFGVNPEESKLVDLLYAYGDSKNKVIYIDWRGEENEREIEEYIDTAFSKEHKWLKTGKLREESENLDREDGKFIIHLLKEIDNDLKDTNERLMFFSTNWDGYGFTVVSEQQFEEIQNFPNSIMKTVDEVYPSL